MTTHREYVTTPRPEQHDAGAIVHVPTPGDHYSPSTGSAVMTIIYQLSRYHEANGGCTRVVVERGTRHDYPAAECVEVAQTPVTSRLAKAIDVALGRAGQPRRNVMRRYRPALEAIEADFRGTVIVHNAPSVLPMFRERARHARIVLYAHNELFLTHSDQEMRNLLQAADRIIAVSHFLAGAIRARLGPLASRVASLVNGVDTAQFVPGPRSARKEPPVVLFVGRVVPEKGADLLLKAAQIAARNGARFRVRIVGSSGFSASAPLTSYERELRRLADPIRDMVEFQPFVDRRGIVDEYQAATIFCAPSNWDEPCSLAVSEAMACGLPIIASRRGGIPDVGDDAILYFVPPDVEALADQITTLLRAPEMRAALGDCARVRAESLAWETRYAKFRTLLYSPAGS